MMRLEKSKTKAGCLDLLPVAFWAFSGGDAFQITMALQRQAPSSKST
jgi:hypothetical protein